MGSFSGGQSLAEQVPERLGYCCLSREKDTVTMPRQYQCHISGVVIMWDRFKAPRMRLGKEAVAAQAGRGIRAGLGLCRAPIAGQELVSGVVTHAGTGKTGGPRLREGSIMPTYVLLSTLTDEGRKTVKERPDRIKEVNQELEGMGARVISQYAVLGAYDFVSIVDAPNNETIARISVELGSRGTVQIMTLPAIPIDEFTNQLRTR
jgi:uncharacterized protein with GYD domain